MMPITAVIICTKLLERNTLMTYVEKVIKLRVDLSPLTAIALNHHLVIPTWH